MRDVEQVVESLLRSRNLGSCVTHHRVQEAVPATYAAYPEASHPALVTALRSRGIERPYSHQAEAAGHALAGRPFVAVTPTASGKTLCYNLPVLSTLLADPAARALYLFPTKALAQDQLAELQGLSKLLPRPIPAYTYDGDTPQDVRRRVRDEAQVVLTNPDMLHQGILPHHPRWARFFGGLRYVVVDEMHVYRGVFGSHVANVFRRLRRVASFHGAEPVFLLCSATLANPKDLGQRLAGRDDLAEVATSGAPRGRKHLVFLNPPIVDPALGVRGSPVTLARKVARRFLREGIQTIAFTRSRLQVEVLARYLKDAMGKSPEAQGLVRGYRGGYLPNLRREIEAGLRDGEIRGVVSTTALELGIDIGQLEASVLVGYPGSVASTWQQAGRAGRRRGTSAAVLIASSLPLDQYVVQHPDEILGRPPELGLIDPDNLSILVSHIRCAAFELPFREGEVFGAEPLEEVLAYLAEKGVLRRAGGRWHWIEDAYPAEHVALRTADPDNFAVVDVTEGARVIAEVDLDSAPTTIHPGAIYMVESVPYHVDRLDWEARKAFVRTLKAEHYTQAITYSKVTILEAFASRGAPWTRAEWGEVHVVTHVPGYKKIRFYTLENIGYGEVTLPDQEMHTTAAWWSFGPELEAELGLPTPAFLGGLAGIAYALQHLSALRCLCDVGDLGTAVGDREGRWSLEGGAGAPAADGAYAPTLFLYERYPGGSGLAEGIHLRAAELLADAVSLVASCPCQAGCPSCVGAAAAAADAVASDAGPKAAARRILSALVSRA